MLTLIDRLNAMAARDTETRDRLAANGELAQGYHPEMRAVHEANADEMTDILRTHGWPDSDAAWLVVQHAISRPDLMRAAVPLLSAAVAEGRAPASHLAHLTDRICYFEDRPQTYGTQLARREDGTWAVYSLANPAEVNARRAEVGLEPLANTQSYPESRPEAHEFAREIGWRNAKN